VKRLAQRPGEQINGATSTHIAQSMKGFSRLNDTRAARIRLS
jgi:hypothetical protein